MRLSGAAETHGYFRSERKVAADRQLFDQFTRDLPFDRTIAFLRDHDLRATFNRSNLDALHRFVELWTNPGRSFHDKRLEQAKQSLWANANGFLDDYSLNTWPVGPSELQEIPKEWEREQPDRYEAVSGRLNRRAGEVVDTYERFGKLARKRLQV